MRSILFAFFLSLSLLSYSQEYKITGAIADKANNQPLEAATIYAETIKDSTLISYTITNQKGLFELEFKTGEKTVNLFISFNGFSTIRKQLDLDKNDIDLQTILLEQRAVELSGVDLVGERSPITIKKDTLEFNADSFKARPDANVEDLLKKLPGVEVDSDGKITVNGREVNQILVNGKPFFGNDTNIATKNLPKEIVDKIQVVDTKTDTEKFTGKESDSENKTINITIKKDKNKGLFGRLTGGYGTDERYQLSGIVNSFNDKQRLSVLASSNNINSAGFSFDEVYDAIGRGANSVSVSSGGNFNIGGLAFGFGQGITTSSNIGGNYANSFKDDKIDLNADYFYANSDSFNDTRTSRENILPDGSFFTDSETNFDGNSNSHRASSRFAFEIDSTLKITLRPRLNVTDANSVNIRNETSSDDTGNLINRSFSRNNSETDQRDFNNELSVIKRFGKKGSFLKFGLENRILENEGFSLFNSENEIFGNTPSTETVNQITNTDATTTGWQADIEYRQALKENLFLDIAYAYDVNKNDNERLVFDFDPNTNDFTLFNDQLSSDFNFRNTQQRPSLGINYEGKKIRFGVTGRFVHTALENNDELQDTDFERDFNDILFNARFRYRNKTKSLNINYRATTVIPQVSQLQPIDNITNPLNIITGNPDLEPTINHRIFLNLNNFDWKTRSGVFIYGNLTIDEDRIVTTTVTDENFIRRTTYENISGNYSMNGGGSWSKRIKKDSVYTARIRLGAFATFNNTLNFNNGLRLNTKRFNINPNASINFNFKEQLEIEPSYRISYNTTSYNIDTFEDVNFVTHNFGLKTTTYWPKNLIWGNDITYTFNGSIADGFQRSSVFWNMSLGLKMLKEQGTLKVLAYDLLNQNINTRRTVTQDFIQDTQGTVLQRYFLLSFTWKFDKFGTGKKRRGRGGVRFF
ncbi:outer membrane beta-barrel protein [Leptobacterium flavescens]|uniref:Outer membrane beta-barrel protein n=1 Tax=Leptobacterium flavescens TaxID=472055 RepID=A0A6P0UNL4_9FLAO|nr:outer membrane beta-barrel protein [Leptobacterium flavescens]NER14894.1 outer membrane beta-barrel protein [Leptobacterium flavescens]